VCGSLQRILCQAPTCVVKADSLDTLATDTQTDNCVVKADSLDTLATDTQTDTCVVKADSLDTLATDTQTYTPLRHTELHIYIDVWSVKIPPKLKVFEREHWLVTSTHKMLARQVQNKEMPTGRTIRNT
jgi:hypothetical protein